MAWQIAKISGSAGPRWYLSKISGTVARVTTAWQIAKISGTVGGSWRVAKISGVTGTSSTPILATPATQTGFPLELITIVAQTTNAVTPDSYAFTSPGVSIAVSGNVGTFQAPATALGGTVTVTITATKGANTSAPVTASVLVTPSPGGMLLDDGQIHGLSFPYQV